MVGREAARLKLEGGRASGFPSIVEQKEEILAQAWVKVICPATLAEKSLFAHSVVRELASGFSFKNGGVKLIESLPEHVILHGPGAPVIGGFTRRGRYKTARRF